MNTKKGVLSIAVIGIAIILVMGAGAMPGSNGKGFGGKGFAEMNSAVRTCMNGSAAECRANTDLNATEMRDCMDKAMAGCKADLNLTKVSGARPRMNNHLMGAGAMPGSNGKDFGGKGFAEMNSTVRTCMNGSAAKCKANTDLNATEMRDCMEKAMAGCNLTVNAGGARPCMKNHLMGAMGECAMLGSNDKFFGGKGFAKMNSAVRTCMNGSAAKCRANTDLNATEMQECMKKAMANCSLNLTVNASGVRPCTRMNFSAGMDFSAEGARPGMFKRMNATCMLPDMHQPKERR